MEITCKRCHQTVLAENSYCPTCGMPQLVYESDAAQEQSQPARWNDAVRDASSVDWKPALRWALLLAIPAGVLSSEAVPTSGLQMLWMTLAASLAVNLYVRSEKPAWITLGAGARIGLATGLLAAWLEFGVSGGALFVRRFILHQTSQISALWLTQVEQSQQYTQQFSSGMSGADAAQMQASASQIKTLMMSPWGHAGFEAFGLAFNAMFLLLFAVMGGTLGAWFLARSRRPVA